MISDSNGGSQKWKKVVRLALNAGSSFYLGYNSGRLCTVTFIFFEQIFSTNILYYLY
jgi:hypothetical protein